MWGVARLMVSLPTTSIALPRSHADAHATAASRAACRHKCAQHPAVRSPAIGTEAGYSQSLAGISAPGVAEVNGSSVDASVDEWAAGETHGIR